MRHVESGQVAIGNRVLNQPVRESSGRLVIDDHDITRSLAARNASRPWPMTRLRCMWWYPVGSSDAVAPISGYVSGNVCNSSSTMTQLSRAAVAIANLG